MLCSDLVRLLQAAQTMHGDLQVKCGNARIVGLSIIKDHHVAHILLKPPKDPRPGYDPLGAP